MKKHKILAIIGTRPEAIKLAPVVLELGGKPTALGNLAPMKYLKRKGRKSL